MCWQDGVSETGVTVAFTVRAMDAGPVLAQERVTVDDAVQAPELLHDLFQRGARLLLAQLPAVKQGTAQQAATPQVCLAAACCWSGTVVLNGKQPAAISAEAYVSSCASVAARCCCVVAAVCLASHSTSGSNLTGAPWLAEQRGKKPQLLSTMLGLPANKAAQTLISATQCACSTPCNELSGSQQAAVQDASRATQAPKLSKEEARLDFSLDAFTAHNKVCLGFT